jgi:hypothetical protein
MTLMVGEGGGDGPEGGPGEDLVELMAGVREIRAIYTTSIEAQDAVDAINRRLFKIGAFQSNQAKYLKKNPSESNSLNLFVRKLEASKTTAESEVTRLQTAEAAAKLDAAKPAPAPATPSIEDQIVESRVEKVLAEINYFKEKISFLKNELRSSTISAANRTTFNSSLKEAEDYLRQLETTILEDAADKNNIKQSEKILFSAQQKKADKLALEQVKTLDQARAAADSLMIPVVGVQKSYTSHESALEAFNNCTARLDELEAFTEATNGSNTLQDRDPLKWSKLVGYISLVKQQKIDAMSAWQRLQATVNNRDAAAVAETDTVDVVKTRNSRKLAAETNAGRLDDAQGRVAEAQALEGLNSMPKFSEANADDAKRAANAAEDVFDANDAHEDIASTKAEVARANRIAELTLKPNKTKAEEAELRELKREELSPLQKQIIKIRTHKDYEDLSSKQKQKLVDDLIRTDASSGSVLPPGVYPGNSAGYNLITGQPNQMMQTQNTSDTIRTNVEQNLKNTVDIRVTGDQSKESVENRDMSFGQKFSRHHKNSAGKFEYQFGISTHEAALAEARLIMQDNEYAIKATWNAMFKQYDNLPQDIKDKVSRMTYDTGGEQYILDLFNSGDALSRMARHGLRFAGEPMGNLHLTTQIDAAGNITYLVRKPYEKGWGAVSGETRCERCGILWRDNRRVRWTRFSVGRVMFRTAWSRWAPQSYELV